MAEQSLLAAFFAAQVAAVSWQEAPSTSTVERTPAWSLSHTSHLHLPTITSFPWTTATLEPPHICGWVDHRPSRYTNYFLRYILISHR